MVRRRAASEAEQRGGTRVEILGYLNEMRGAVERAVIDEEAEPLRALVLENPDEYDKLEKWETLCSAELAQGQQQEHPRLRRLFAQHGPFITTKKHMIVGGDWQKKPLGTLRLVLSADDDPGTRAWGWVKRGLDIVEAAMRASQGASAPRATGKGDESSPDPMTSRQIEEQFGMPAQRVHDAKGRGEISPVGKDPRGAFLYDRSEVELMAKRYRERRRD